MIIKNKNKILIVGYGQDAKVLKDQASKDNKKIYIITKSKKNIKEKNVFFKTLDIKDKNKVSKYLKNFKNLHIYFFATHNISSTEEENSQIFYKNLDHHLLFSEFFSFCSCFIDL